VVRPEPFPGYSWLLRTIIWVLVPAFAAWQFVRLKRAFHVFQLESYKRPWFRQWCAAEPRRRLFLERFEGAKKPLVMTGRAWRTIITGTALTIFGILIPSGLMHINFGTPFDLITCSLMFAVMFVAVPEVLMLSDLLMTPIQKAINWGYLRAARRKLHRIRPIVVGVTGSYGKTSTKFAIERIVGASARVLATPSSFNTPLGVARTINEFLEDSHEVFVVEMGARQVGDVAAICRAVAPTVAVLTAIGPAHLETFGSLEAIRRTKFEIVRSLPAGGIAVLNVDDPEVAALAAPGPHPPELTLPQGVKVIRYGLDQALAPDVTAVDVRQGARGTDLTVVAGDVRIEGRTRLLGKHALGHLLAGVAVAVALEHDLGPIPRALQDMEPVEHRLQIIEGAGGVIVIDDAYNSNPEGAAEALEVLKKMPGGQKIVITPGMVELGDRQRSANIELGRRAAEVADVLIAVADINGPWLLEGAAAVPQGAKAIAVRSLAEATERLAGLVSRGDVVLFENDLPDQYER
jgi:UDP-N-acetylmuramoyl-tripeptide--D-alanyl-D-alanine ligase